MKCNFFTRPGLVGLDVHDNQVNLVQLKKTKQGYLVQQAAQKTLASDIVTEGEVVSWHQLSLSLAQWFKALNIRDEIAAINLPVHLTKLQHISLPCGLSEEEIQTEIYQTLGRDVQTKKTVFAIDFAISASNRPGYLDVYFVATDQDYLLKYIHCITEAGLKVKIVDINIYALKRFVCFVQPSLIKEKPVLRGARSGRFEGHVSAILFLLNKNVFLLIFDRQKIIFFQVWSYHQADDFLNNLKASLERFCYAFQEKSLIELALCGDYQIFHQAIVEILTAFSIEICTPNLLIHLTLGERMDPICLENKLAHFLIPMGIAMREIPRW